MWRMTNNLKWDDFIPKLRKAWEKSLKKNLHLDVLTLSVLWPPPESKKTFTTNTPGVLCSASGNEHQKGLNDLKLLTEPAVCRQVRKCLLIVFFSVTDKCIKCLMWKVKIALTQFVFFSISRLYNEVFSVIAGKPHHVKEEFVKVCRQTQPSFLTEAGVHV